MKFCKPIQTIFYLIPITLVLSIVFLLHTKPCYSAVLNPNNISLQTAIERGYREMLSICHRGYSIEAPENTLPAFKMAAEKGFKYIETDVKFTSDGVPVLLHDEKINRTARYSNGATLDNDINISDITYEQALSYDFGIWFGEGYAGTKIPTFEEYISFCAANNITPVIELKRSSLATASNVLKLLETVKKYNLEKSAFWISFFTEADLLEPIKNNSPESKFIISADSYSLNLRNITYSNFIDMVKQWKTQSNTVFAGTDYTFLSLENIDIAKSNDINIVAWTINNELDILYLDNVVKGVMSDFLNAEEVVNKNFAFDISYELYGGTSDNKTHYTADTDTFTLNHPVKNGYTFLGWIGNGINYPEKDITIPKGTKGDLFFTAVWEKNTSDILHTNELPTLNDTIVAPNADADKPPTIENKKNGTSITTILIPCIIAGGAIITTIVILTIKKKRS